MTDCNQTLPQPWHSELKPNDIVAYRFPHERSGAQEPKVRPTLVIDILRIGDERFAVLAYGTSSPRRRARDLLVLVTAPAEIDTASLKEPTQFDAARRILVSLCDDGFSHKRGSPVLGQLSGESAVRARIVRRQVRGETGVRKTSLYRMRPRSKHQRKTEVGTPWAKTGTQTQETKHV